MFIYTSPRSTLGQTNLTLQQSTILGTNILRYQSFSWFIITNLSHCAGVSSLYIFIYFFSVIIALGLGGRKGKGCIYTYLDNKDGHVCVYVWVGGCAYPGWEQKGGSILMSELG